MDKGNRELFPVAFFFVKKVVGRSGNPYTGGYFELHMGIGHTHTMDLFDSEIVLSKTQGFVTPADRYLYKYVNLTYFHSFLPKLRYNHK
jgi:GH24 family phage-related lysozyme (muramidase)